MNDNLKAVFYDIRKDEHGWTVFHMETGEPACVNDVPQSGLDIKAADDLCDALDELERQKAHATIN